VQQVQWRGRVGPAGLQQACSRLHSHSAKPISQSRDPLKKFKKELQDVEEDTAHLFFKQ